jgi:hypothetical protein
MSLGTGIDANAMASAEGAALDRGVRAQYIVSQAVAALATGGGCLFGAVGGVVEVWNLSDNSTVRTSAASESGEPVVAAATSSDGGRLAIAMASDPVRIRSVSDGSQIYHLAVLEPCRTRTLAFGHGNELLHGIITPATADHDDDAWRRNHTVSGSVGQLRACIKGECVANISARAILALPRPRRTRRWTSLPLTGSIFTLGR